MAGEGARFRQTGSGLPKYMIPAKGRALFEWALMSLAAFFEHEFIFIARRSPVGTDFINDKCRALGVKNFRIQEIDQLTDGQATTALQAEGLIADSSRQVMIYNIDTYVQAGELTPELIRGDGWIPVFEAEGCHWSFAEFASDGRINAVAEKNRISRYASIGLYYFKSFDLFKKASRDYYKSNNAQEKYIAPVYNILLQEGRLVYASLLDKEKVHVLGTPEEVKIFEENAS